MKLSTSRIRHCFIAGVAVLLFIAVPAVAQTGGGGLASSSGASVASTSTVSLTIPGVVAIDVETDLAFDLADKLGAAPLSRAGAACVNDTFPPAAGCTGPLIYTATSGTTTSTAPTPAPATGDVWLSLYTNKTGAGSTISLSATAGGWSSAPVGTNTDLQVLLVRGSANPGTIGNAGGSPAVLVPGGAGATLSGSVAGPFGWTRYDQNITLRVQDGSGNASGVTFNTVSNATTTITFTANAA